MEARPAIRLASRPQLPPTLKTVTVDPASLVRVSSHATARPTLEHGAQIASTTRIRTLRLDMGPATSELRLQSPSPKRSCMTASR